MSMNLKIDTYIQQDIWVTWPTFLGK